MRLLCEQLFDACFGGFEGGGAAAKKRTPAETLKDPDTLAIERMLSDALGLGVSISHNGVGESGRLHSVERRADFAEIANGVYEVDLSAAELTAAEPWVLAPMVAISENAPLPVARSIVKPLSLLELSAQRRVYCTACAAVCC